MDVMTKAEVDKVERIALEAKPIRPRDAATLILLDRKGDEFLVLMGRRHARHAFMPGKFVFPGGRTDPADSRIPVATALQPEEQARLTAGVGRTSPARARAIALSAIRETYEEAGLLIGQKGAFATTRRDWQGFAEHGVRPSLEALRFVARAITPPNRVRRFDTRFFSAWREDVAVELPDGGPTNELEELVWLPLAKAREADIPDITRAILEELEKRLVDDPLLRPGGSVPFYRLVRNRFVREIL
ncbi:MAG: NUDIX domain-containing protein [Mesorhizobium sp.]|uniref:NUDIX hydrolase n=1 Tax=unclassified Mesorhizobium TaxID=325217 RepID=UPI000FCCDCBE|nr:MULTISPECIES: NUDIX domain-containing protein [unclassified Mesorhizobium]RUV66713.1 NUDIX domain-containing protein [Mesorhizobium sp. M5C.F.Cr.IN.023.01.1.1]RWF86362.1 MAG: NUDIX domain-containing protein [Mesorhizobium sp.]RWF93428.1 MAG: NUDIX domain-containing protein [Mesorhizobium sp.]RWI38437.1 MAG: NUDIX domain-containing protein [Mesorhizobium sp.]RWI45604.1 MAG: NUDIX domain-containing protein [Mesorhizobium sp.]